MLEYQPRVFLDGAAAIVDSYTRISIKKVIFSFRSNSRKKEEKKYPDRRNALVENALRGEAMRAEFIYKRRRSLSFARFQANVLAFLRFQSTLIKAIIDMV